MRNFFAIILFFNLFSFEVLAQTYRETSFEERPNCEAQSGVWREFGNGCVDGCLAKLDSFAVCTQEITNGCDCGKNRCWDGGACVKISDYKTTYDEEKKKEQVVLDKAKKERQGSYKEYQQTALDKISKQVSNSTESAKNVFNDNKEKVSNFLDKDQNKNQPGEQKSKLVTNNEAQNNNQNQANSATADFEVPPFFLQKQKQLADKAADSAAQSSNAGLKNGAITTTNTDKGQAIPILPGLPEIPLP
jgi:hypothetical protein